MDPGELVANGLNLGHGYNVNFKTQNASFLDTLDKELISESKTSEQVLMGYSVSTQTFPERGSLKFLPGQTSQSLVKSTESSTEIVIIEEDQAGEELKVIDFTAISRTKLNRLNPNPPKSPNLLR